MNPFDILARNLPRPVDPQAMRDQALASENVDNGFVSGDVESFDTLLKGLSGRIQEGETDSRSGGQDVKSDVRLGENTSGAEGASIADTVLSLLQSILPGAAPRSAAPLPSVNDDQSGASPHISIEGMVPQQEEGEVPSSAPEPRMVVAVKHQETHFKPIVEELHTKIAKSQEEAVNSAGELVDEPISNKPLVAIDNRRPESPRDNRLQVQPFAAPLAREPVESDDTDIFLAGRENLASRSVKEAEAPNPASPHLSKQGEAAGLPSETLHRMASAVKAELQAASEDSAFRSAHADGAPRTISVKASESVLRVLNLQLHPAHLGAVTVKMRLSGESLEMELHVEREETAQLLRTDSEKLSALLRGSGYRPDAISIYVNDAAAQDRTASSRPQSDFQMQGQGFQQGSASHDERSRNREQFASTKAEQYNHDDETATLAGRSTGGVYL